MNKRTFVVSAFLTATKLFVATLIVEPALAQLGMTNPVDPPVEPCTLQSNQISPPTILPTGLLPQTYRWAPAAFLEGDPNNGGFTKPDEQNGRLHYFLRTMAQSAASPDTATNRLVLVNAVLLYLGLTKPTVSISGVGVNSNSSINAKPQDIATVVAQFAVTGRRAYNNFISWHSPAGAFSGPQDADLIQLVQKTNPTIQFHQADLQAAVSFVLDASYSALWAIRSNDPVWRAKRAQITERNGWIAVSGEDDTPHRPVNVPTAPFPQYDLPVTLSGPYGTITAVTRYMVASAGTFIGPGTPPPDALLDAPVPLNTGTNAGTKTGTIGRVSGIAAGTGLSGQNRTGLNLGASQIVTRRLPVDDLPIIPPGSKIIIYIHGGGSRLEEAVPLASWLITYGRALPFNQQYTVISFDMPNSAYGDSFDPAAVYGSTYHPTMSHILMFEEQYVINFIEALDQKVGNIKNRIAAVMGGSLGGNMSLLLARESTQKYPYLRTIVAWSPTSMLPVHGDIGNGIVKWGNLSGANWGPEATNTRADYFYHLYFEKLSNLLDLPADPVMWFWDGWVSKDGTNCKASEIAQSRFDRYEVYSSMLRRWTTAIDTEQAVYSFQDPDGPGSPPRFQQIGGRLLLVAGEKDCYTNACRNSLNPLSVLLSNTIDIYGYTHDVANLMRGASGRTLFIKNTGHSIHDERPRFFAQEIVHFLNMPDTNVRVDLKTGNSGLRWNSVVDVTPYIKFNGTCCGWPQNYPLNRWWHPWLAISPDNPCSQNSVIPCEDLYAFMFQPRSVNSFTIGLSRENYTLRDIQNFRIGFDGHGQSRPTDSGDNWDLIALRVAAISSPAGTGQMLYAQGTPLWRGTSPSHMAYDAWISGTITQPTQPQPVLSVAVVSQGLSTAGGNAWVVVQARDPKSSSAVLGTVTINGVTGNTLEQIAFKNTCGTGCVGSVYAPNYADGLFTAAGPTATTQGIIAGGPLSASVCPTVDGRSCLPANAPRTGSPLMDIVRVTSGGPPVRGATVSVSGQPTYTAVTNASGVAVITHLPCFAPGSQVSQVGKPAPVRTPVPCGAMVSKPGYQSFGTTLP